MKRFAKVALALVLAVALVLPLMPAVKAVDPEVDGDKDVSVVLDLDRTNLDKLEDEKIAAANDVWDSYATESVNANVKADGPSLAYQVKQAWDDEASGATALDTIAQDLANASGVSVNYKVLESYEDIAAEDGKVTIQFYFGKAAETADEPEEEEAPEKKDGYYEVRPYFVTGKESCKMLRDWEEDDVQDLLDDLNERASWSKVNNVPDVDLVSEHVDLEPYEEVAKNYNDDYGYVTFRFGTPYSVKDWKEGDVELSANVPETAEEAVNNRDLEEIKVHNGLYYVPVYVDYNPKEYEVYWKIVPNKTSLEKAMGYWPGRDLTEDYDNLVDGNPFKAELWAIENINEFDACEKEVPIPIPTMRINDKGGIWFYAPKNAPKAVKVKDSDPMKFEVTFEYIFAGTEEYEKNFKGKVETPAKKADQKVAAKPATAKTTNPGTGDVMVLSYLVSGIAAAGAYVATKHNR